MSYHSRRFVVRATAMCATLQHTATRTHSLRLVTYTLVFAAADVQVCVCVYVCV